MKIQEYIRLPEKIVAVQWFPYSRLPEVDPIYAQVDRQVDYINGPEKAPKQVIEAGKVIINQKAWRLEPSDYVIYNSKTMEPLQAMSESNFKASFVSTSLFCLCSDCEAKVKDIAEPQHPTSLEEVKALFESGRGPFPVKTSAGIRMAYTFDQFMYLKELQDKQDQQPKPDA